MIQLPTDEPEKITGSSAWAAAIHIGDLDGASGSKLWPSTALAIEAIWEGKSPLSLPVTLSSDLQKEQIIYIYIL